MIINSFVNNLFGTIAGASIPFPSDKSFIPLNGSGKTIDIKGDNASWLGLQSPMMQKFAYDFCFPVSSVVDRLAEMDINGEVGIYREKGKGKQQLATSSYAVMLNKLLSQPNPFQTWAQFRGQQVVYKHIFGYCPVLPIVPAAMSQEYTTQMINLPPWLFDVVPNLDAPVIGAKQEEIIKEYTFTLYGKVAHLRPEQVIILEGSFIQNESKHFLLPQSKLVGLDMAISNICAAMEADNVLLKKKGPLGFVSHDAAATKDSIAGYLPMSKREKRELQTQLSGYGLSLQQYQYVISRTAAKWNPMSYDVKQLGTKETLMACEKAICHRFGYPYILYEESESTYANGDNASASVYQNNVIPNAKKDMAKYAKFFKASENNVEIKINYDEIAALQEDKQMMAEADLTTAQAAEIQWKNNIITKNQWLEKQGYEPLTTGGDVYFSDSPAGVEGDSGQINTDANGQPLDTPVDVEADSKAKLKGSVGGVQGILETQKSVAAGITDYEAAVTLLFEIFGFDDATARKLLGDKSKLEQKLNAPKPQPVVV